MNCSRLLCLSLIPLFVVGCSLVVDTDRSLRFADGGPNPADCNAGEVFCGESCADLDRDPLHCGGCGEACPEPEGMTATCDDGVCGTECAEGYHLLETGECVEILFSDDFADGEIDPQWNPWRFEFDEHSRALWVVSEPREGFPYGHFDSGRYPEANTHIGDTDWTDYRYEVTFGLDAPGAYNPYGFATCYRGGEVLFRLEEREESWNEPANTHYQFSIQTADCEDASTAGRWSVSRRHGTYIPGYGWSDISEGSGHGIGSGENPELLTGNVVSFVVEAVGESFTIWLNGHLLIEWTEAPEDYTEEQEPILFGGVGVKWGWESTGWIEHILVTRMPPDAD